MLDEIVNDGIVYSQPSFGNFEKTPALKKIKLTNFEDDNPTLLRESIVEIEKPLSSGKIFPSIDSPLPRPPRTKEYFVDYSDNDDDESDDESDDMSIDHLPPPDKVKFLPTTIDGLRANFEALLKNIAVIRNSGGYENTSDRNETVFLLDELIRQGGISRRMYRQYNDFLAESLPVVVGFGIIDEDVAETAMENEHLSEEYQLKKKITSIADYLIEHDKKELVELVNEIEKDEEIVETVTALEEFIKIYLEREFLERESVAEKIHELVDRLSNSKHIPKSVLVKIKMLVNDIAKNRERVREIVNRFNQAGDDSKSRLWIIEQLAKEKLLSEQQYFKLAEVIDEIDIEQLTDVIRESKIGQGMDFLPRKTGELFDTLREWIQEFVENGGTTLQNKISSLLNELFQRKKISEERYNELKEEHNIM